MLLNKETKPNQFHISGGLYNHQQSKVKTIVKSSITHDLLSTDEAALMTTSTEEE